MSRLTWGILAAYYFTYFGVLGVFLPFWPLYLDHLGVEAAAIGVLLSVGQAVKVVGPPVWGHLADSGQRRRVLLFTSLVATLLFALFLYVRSFPALFLVTLLFSFFHSAPLALVEASTLESSERAGWDYGRIRLWGSVGFILCTLAAGPLVDGYGIVLVPMGLLFLHSLSLCFALGVPDGEPGGHEHVSGRKIKQILTRPGVAWFFLSTMLMQFSHGAYYGFFSLHLASHDYSRMAIGQFWSIGVVAEVVVLMQAKSLVARFGPGPLLSISLFLAFVRWFLYSWTIHPLWLGVGQLLHAFTFGAFHVASVRRAFLLAPPGGRATLQAWYGSISFGLGGSLGALVAGVLYAGYGAHVLFLVMASAALAGVFASLRADLVLAKGEKREEVD